MKILYSDRDIAVCIKPTGMDSEKQVPEALKEQLGGEIYTLTVTDSDFYEVVFNTALDTETTISVSTESGATRVLLFGMNSYTK